MVRDEELRLAVIRQIVYQQQTFSGEIARALQDYKDRVTSIMKTLAREGYCTIYEGAFYNTQIHYVRYEELKKLLPD